MQTKRPRVQTAKGSALSATAGLLILTTACRGASAQVVSEWEFTIAPYLWGSSLSGVVGTFEGVPPADVDASFGEIFEDLDAGAMLVANANNGRFGVTVDLQLIDLKAETDDLAPAFGTTTVDVVNRVGTLTFECNVSASDRHEVWLAAGARYWSVGQIYRSRLARTRLCPCPVMTAGPTQ